jgi:hypothetical protein
MPRLVSFRLVACALLAALWWQSANAADVDPCTRFKWNVSRELALMKQTPQPISAAVRPGADMPQLRVGILYAVKLADQAVVRFAAEPAKALVNPGARAGLMRFRVNKAGRYRVSITGGHWIDVLDGVQAVPSVDFQGHVGCERPSKIVEFDLPAERELTLQLSGSSDAEVVMGITAVGTSSAS